MTLAKFDVKKQNNKVLMVMKNDSLASKKVAEGHQKNLEKVQSSAKRNRSSQAELKCVGFGQLLGAGARVCWCDFPELESAGITSVMGGPWRGDAWVCSSWPTAPLGVSNDPDNERSL